MFKKKEKEKKKTEESVAEPKAKPAAAAAAAADRVIAAMPDSVIVLDLDGKVTSINPEYTRMFGWKPEDRIGKSFTEFKSLKAEDIERFMKLLGKLVETGHVEPIETLIRTKDGREIPISVAYSLINDAKGNPQNIIAVLRDITELKKAEEERREAEAVRDRAAIADAMGDGLALVGMDGKVLYANPGLEKITGYEASVGVEKDAAEMIKKFFKPEETEKVIGMLGTAFEGKTPPAIPFTIIAKDGREVPVVSTVSFIRDQEGKPTTLVVMMKDISELKRLQEKEKEVAAMRMAADVIEAMPDPLFVVDLEGVILSTNPAHTKVFGRKAEEIVGKSFAELTDAIKPEDIERFMKVLGELIETGGGKFIESVIYTKDGRGIPVSVTYSLIKDTDGNPKNIIAALRDITELKRAEEERARALAERAATMDSIADALMVVDVDGNIVSMNRVMEEVLIRDGFNPKELIGKPALEIPMIRPEDVGRLAELMKEAVEKGGAGPTEVFIQRPDGSEGWHSFTISVMKDEKGNPRAFIALTRDITELKRLQEREKAAAAENARAEEAEKYSKELERKIRDLERFQKVTMDREKRVLELKEEIKELKKQLESEK